jgi:hypothetical protein
MQPKKDKMTKEDLDNYRYDEESKTLVYDPVERSKMDREPVEVPPNQIRNILDLMAKYGIIRITFDPTVGHGSHVEIWQRTKPGMDGRIKGDLLLTYVEREYFAQEYDKCFGTTPRSDE